MLPLSHLRLRQPSRSTLLLFLLFHFGAGWWQNWELDWNPGPLDFQVLPSVPLIMPCILLLGDKVFGGSGGEGEKVPSTLLKYG